jgi:hypothetical protein
VLMQIDFEHDERAQRKRKLKREREKDDNGRGIEEDRGKASIDSQRLKISLLGICCCEQLQGKSCNIRNILR